MRSPAFQFYPNDFLGSPVVQGLDATGVGVYLLLLILDWNGDGFTLDFDKLSRKTRVTPKVFAAIWEDLSPCFVCGEDGRFRNPRLQRERAKQAAYSRRMSDNGKMGGRPKAEVKPELSHPRKAVALDRKTIPFPSPVPTSEKPPVSPPVTQPPLVAKPPRKRGASSNYSAEFEAAWQAYPPHSGSKQKAWDQWQKRLGEGVAVQTLHDGVSRYSEHIQRTGEYVRHPATFFGSGRWFETDYAAAVREPSADDLLRKAPREMRDRIARIEAIAAEDAAEEARTTEFLKSRGAR